MSDRTDTEAEEVGKGTDEEVGGNVAHAVFLLGQLFKDTDEKAGVKDTGGEVGGSVAPFFLTAHTEVKGVTMTGLPPPSTNSTISPFFGTYAGAGEVGGDKVAATGAAATVDETGGGDFAASA